MSERYAVIGQPVAHSKSPWIHAQFARATRQDIDYRLIEAPADGFTRAADEFRAAGGKGLNVTLPFKEDAYQYCAQLSPRARDARAVNTIRFGTETFGDNTDGVGLVRDLTDRHRIDLRARRTLLLGAGGGARGVAPALLDAGIGDLYVVNRTPERADALADMLSQPGRVHPRYVEDLGAIGEFDFILNATSAARGGTLPPLPMSLAGHRTLAVDLGYADAAFPFMAWARAAGCRDVVDGLGMLVEQAAESFQLWHGVRPDTDPVYAALREREYALVAAD